MQEEFPSINIPETVVNLQPEYLQEFAGFIRSKQLHSFCSYYRKCAAEEGFDILSYANAKSEDDLQDILVKLNGSMLALIENGDVYTQIARSSMLMFPANEERLEVLQQKSLDISRADYLRKKTFLFFAKEFSKDPDVLIQLIGEIDAFCYAYEKVILKRYTDVINKAIEREKAAEQRLLLREEQLLEAQQFASIGSFVWNVTEMHSEVTPELLDILDIESPDDFHGFMDKVHIDDRPALDKSLQAALDGNGPYDSTYRYHGKSQEKILRSRGVVTHENGVLKMRGTVSDVTQQQTMINRLEKSEMLYKEAQEMARIGNWSVDLTDSTIELSDEVYRIFGIAPGTTLTFETIKTIIHPHDLAGVQQHFKDSVITGKSCSDIARLVMQDGTQKIVEYKGRTECGTDGSVIAFFGTVQDVSNEQGLITKLKETSALYKQMETLAHIGSWTLDIASGKVHWSEELFRIYDMVPTTENVDREAVKRFVFPDDLERTGKGIEKCLIDGTPYEYEYRITLPDGTVKTLHGKGEAARDNIGNIIRIFGTVQDMTKQEDLVRKLRKSEEGMKLAQSIAHMGSGTYNLTTGLSEWSDELYNIFEIEKDLPLTFENSTLLFRQIDKEIISLHVKRCAEGGIPYDFFGIINLPGGRAKNLRIKGKAEHDTDGTITHIFYIIQDITEQKLTEQRLRENQRYSQKINDVTPAVITILNIQTGTYELVSRMVETLLGYDPQEWITGGFSSVAAKLHPDDAEATMTANAAALERANEDPDYQDDKIVEFRYRLQHKDGNWRYIQTSAIIFDRDEDGKVLHILNVSIDITQLMHTEEKLRMANATLQQSNSSLQEFAYIASHDLQEPLRKISTFGNMLETLQQEEISEKGKMYLRKIVESSIRMQSMISDILSVSVIAGNSAFESQSLQPLFEEAMATLDHKIEQTGAQIIMDRELPIARVIAPQWRQLFQNLVGNSLKFIRPDVTPVITINYTIITGENAINKGLDGAGKYYAITITDNGIGFSNEYANRIFAIFQRLNGKSEYEGTGIGLAICKKIVEHHGGTITATGVFNEGAAFTIVIPVN